MTTGSRWKPQRRNRKGIDKITENMPGPEGSKEKDDDNSGPHPLRSKSQMCTQRELPRESQNHITIWQFLINTGDKAWHDCTEPEDSAQVKEPSQLFFVL